MSAVKLIVVALAVAGAAGCSGSAPNAPPPAPAPEVVTNASVVTQISHPDEAMKALASLAKPEDWKKYVDAGTAVSSSNKLILAAAIGMQSANGVAAEYAGDSDTAQKLATSVKSIADRMSLKSAALESLVAKTSSDFKEPDATKRSTLVRTDMAQVQDELKNTLDRLGDGDSSAMMLFGAWIEGVRMAGAVLQAKYDATASDVLNRKNEADYFLAHFAAAPSGADAVYGQIKPALTKLRDAMTADKTHHVDKASVGAIQAAAAEITGVLRKG